MSCVKTKFLHGSFCIACPAKLDTLYKNLISVDERMSQKQKIETLTDRLVRLLTEADLERFHEHS